MRQASAVSRLLSLVFRGAFALLISGCGFSPLAHRIDVGQEPIVIFVGEGIDRHTDLFAVAAGGGAVAQVTFTPLLEQNPRITPAGDVVAFLRSRDTLPGTHRDVILMNLLTGGEVSVTLPQSAGEPVSLGWNDSATAIYIRTPRGIWRASTPPRIPVVVPVASGDSATADSILDTWLGTPRFARVINCAGPGLCIIGPRGDTTSLTSQGAGAIRWGSDSVGWFENGAMVVRPLGPGRSRRVLWTEAPEHARDGSYSAGPTAKPDR
jgi:hypothetical protein